MARRGGSRRIPNHLILCYLTLVFAGAFGIVAGVTGTSTLSLFGIAQFQFTNPGAAIPPLIALGIASIAVTGYSIWTAEALHLGAAACYAGWGLVSLFVSSGPSESRIIGAAAMFVIALAFLADRLDGRERALSARRPED